MLIKIYIYTPINQLYHITFTCRPTTSGCEDLRFIIQRVARQSEFQHSPSTPQMAHHARDKIIISNYASEFVFWYEFFNTLIETGQMQNTHQLQCIPKAKLMQMGH
jgi:hypothetical protein